jgi:hypothetical protein
MVARFGAGRGGELCSGFALQNYGFGFPLSPLGFAESPSPLKGRWKVLLFLYIGKEHYADPSSIDPA